MRIPRWASYRDHLSSRSLCGLSLSRGSRGGGEAQERLGSPVFAQSGVRFPPYGLVSSWSRTTPFVAVRQRPRGFCGRVFGPSSFLFCRTVSRRGWLVGARSSRPTFTGSGARVQSDTIVNSLSQAVAPGGECDSIYFVRCTGRWRPRLRYYLDK